MRDPSTSWRESIADDEEKRFAEYAALFAEMQRKKSEKWGKGRALHRKQLLALPARLDVLPDLPAHARHGLFAHAGAHDALVRFSNGGVDRAKDHRPDVRGMAIKIHGVEGPSALGGTTVEQDFLLINHSKFNVPKSDEFVGLALAAAVGPGSLIRYMIGRYGFFAGLGRLRDLGRSFGQKFGGFAAERLFSAAPIACGPYAAKVRLLPSASEPAARDDKDWANDLVQRLLNGDLAWQLQLQFYVDEAITPIEDASVEWPEIEAPFVTVARLTIPKGSAGDALSASTEAMKFDPWNALVEHRPLGDVMRARKVVYFESQKARGVA